MFDELSTILRQKNIMLFLVLGLFLIVFTPYLLTRSTIFESLNFTETGQIGDTIGGITSPFMNLVGSILVFLALKEQIEANKISQKENLHQKIVLKLSSLEELSLSSKYKPKKLDKKLRMFLQMKHSGNFTDNENIKYIFHLTKIKHVTNNIKAVFFQFRLQTTYNFDARQSLELDDLMNQFRSIYVYHYKIYFNLIINSLQLELPINKDETISLLINSILTDIKSIEKELGIE